MIRVTAPSRLHFGLLHVPTVGEPANSRHFGGLGLMIRQPEIALTVEAAGAWSATGQSADRSLSAARRAVEQSPVELRQPLKIAVESCPPEHVGLGVGTQLAMAATDAVCRLLTDTRHPPDELAKRSGRGERSRIGVEGYSRGGLLLDGGQHPARPGASTILHRGHFPDAWRVLLLRPRTAERWHGDRERLAFARPRDPEANLRTTERLCRLALLGILPALHEVDLPVFGEALHDFNRTAGEAFASDQGGPYCCTAVTALIGWLRSEGIAGTGQSSWGPTVFAAMENVESAERLLIRASATGWEFESTVIAEGYSPQSESNHAHQ